MFVDFSSPKIMGILNVTPDSFSDGNQFFDVKEAELRIGQMISEGADIIDIGGESTGPGSSDVSLIEEMARVKPVIDFAEKSGLVQKVLFSIDTYKSEVAEYALAHGFRMVNDVTALRGDPKMIDVLLEFKPYIVLMYSKDPTARTTKQRVEYADVVKTVIDFLKTRAQILLDAGFPKKRIILDPGMGAFVSAEPKYSFELIDRLSELKALGYPILVGVSRKSFLGGKIEDREQPSVEWSLKAIQNGASIVRIHNTKMLIQTLRHR